MPTKAGQLQLQLQPCDWRQKQQDGHLPQGHKEWRHHSRFHQHIGCTVKADRDSRINDGPAEKNNETILIKFIILTLFDMKILL
jgi:hypothetical protein